MKQSIKLILFAVSGMVAIWNIFQGIAEQNNLMLIGSVLVLITSILLTWAETKTNN